MRKFLAITLLAFVVILFATWLIDPIQQDVHPQYVIGLDPEIEPGEIEPAHSVCDWSEAEQGLRYCYNAIKRGYSYAISLHTRRITEVSYLVVTQHIAIGSLVQAWGRPDGYTRIDEFVVLYWHGCRCSAWLFTDQFQPLSEIGFISMGNDVKYEDWKGFR